MPVQMCVMPHWTRIRLGAHQDHFLLRYHQPVMVSVRNSHIVRAPSSPANKDRMGSPIQQHHHHMFLHEINHTIRLVLLLICKACDGQHLHGGHSHDDVHDN